MTIENIDDSEIKRISKDLHFKIHRFLNQIKSKALKIEEEVKAIEELDIGTKMDQLIEDACREMLELKKKSEQ